MLNSAKDRMTTFRAGSIEAEAHEVISTSFACKVSANYVVLNNRRPVGVSHARIIRLVIDAISGRRASRSAFGADSGGIGDEVVAAGLAVITFGGGHWSPEEQGGTGRFSILAFLTTLRTNSTDITLKIITAFLAISGRMLL